MSAHLNVEIPNQDIIQMKIGPLLSLGRGKNNTLVIPDSAASRNHAAIMMQGENLYQVADIGSRNGTLLNGQRLTQTTPLKSGDQIQIGKCRLTFICKDNEATSKDPVQDFESVTIANFQTRKVVVFVMDIRNYTKLSEVLEAKELTDLAAHWYLELGNVIEKNGGVVDKIIGDAVMALWTEGAVKIEAHAEKAIITAYEAINIAKKFEHRLKEHHPELDFRIGCGINMGMAALGNIGHRDNRDYTAMGDCVNVAFRIESQCKILSREILISSELKDILPDAFSYEDLGKHELKGKSKPTHIFSIATKSIAKYVKAQSSEPTSNDSAPISQEEGYLEKAERLFYEGKAPEALAVLDETPPPEGFLVEHLTTKIAILVKLERWKEVQELSESFIVAASEDIWGYYIRSLALLQLGQAEEARAKLFEGDIEGQLEHSNVNHLMTCIELSLGNVEKAKAHASRAVQQEPELLAFFMNDPSLAPVHSALEHFQQEV